MYRILNQTIQQRTDKVKILLGARQVGKTTLLKNAFPGATYINIEKSNYIDIFNSRDIMAIKDLVYRENAGKKINILILDEVQRLNDPGLVTKVLYDEWKDIQLIISGSSSLEIANKASESLAGRKKTFKLYPLSFKEKLIQENKIQLDTKSINFNVEESTQFQTELKESMQFGLYPELLNIEDKVSYLQELVDSSILKDVFYLNLVKDTKSLLSLIRLLAYQIGQQINVTELSSRIGIERPTVLRYLEILKKTFIVYTLSPYTKKRRDEIGKTEKVYFYDLGIRNAIINDFSPIEFRNDYGSIFENFAINEIIKLNSYYELNYQPYYWKTKWGSEIDLILQKDTQLYAIEFKLRKGSITSAFKNIYEQAQEKIITLENIESMIL
jgi:hypothetical protein